MIFFNQGTFSTLVLGQSQRTSLYCSNTFLKIITEYQTEFRKKSKFLTSFRNVFFFYCGRNFVLVIYEIKDMKVYYD